MLRNDTIAAIATPAGDGAVGIIRLSGPSAIPIFTRVWAGKIHPSQFEHRCVYLGGIIHPKDDSRVDRVLAFLMKAPSSYTGEDVVEIQGHGGWRVMEVRSEE